MNVLKNKVEAYNKLIKTMNEVMPQVVAVFKDTAPNWRKKDGSLLKKVKDRLDQLLGRHGKIMMYASSNQFSISISIVFQTNYQDGEHTCDYISQRCYVVDNGEVVSWKPMNMVSLEGIEHFLEEKAKLEKEIEQLLNRFYSDWDVVPYEFKGDELRLR